MSVTKTREVIGYIKQLGVEVIEYPGWETRGNGMRGFVNGEPDFHIAHHLVAKLTLTAQYISMLADMAANGHASLSGPICNWFVDALGRVWVIAALPANHAGKGDSRVISKVRNGQKVGRATVAGDITGNGYSTGIEPQHPGDSTPWPKVIIRAMSAIHAGECKAYNHKVNAVLQHGEWSNRKIDMAGFVGDGDAYRAIVQDALDVLNGHKAPDPVPAPTPTPIPEEDILSALTDEEQRDLYARIGRIDQALYIQDGPFKGLPIPASSHAALGGVVTTVGAISTDVATSKAVVEKIRSESLMPNPKGGKYPFTYEQHAFNQLTALTTAVGAIKVEAGQPIDVKALAGQLVDAFGDDLAGDLASELGRRLSA